MMASPALNLLMDQDGCSQVGYRADSSSWVGGDGLGSGVPPCSHNAKTQKALVGRAESETPRSPALGALSSASVTVREGVQNRLRSVCKGWGERIV